MQFIDLKAQYAALKGEIDANIQDVLNSAAFIGGKYVKELETQLAALPAVSTASPAPTAPTRSSLPSWRWAWGRGTRCSPPT